MDSISNKVNRSEIDIYHTVGRMKFTLDSTIDFGFEENTLNDYSIVSDVEKFNFKELSRGELFAYSKKPESFFTEALDEEDYFETRGDKIFIKKSFIPAMITKNITIIKDDCFGYIMEKYQI